MLCPVDMYEVPDHCHDHFTGVTGGCVTKGRRSNEKAEQETAVRKCDGLNLQVNN